MYSGAADDGATTQQQLRLVHCASRAPDAWDRPVTKRVADLWDDGNVQAPLHLTPHGERSAGLSLTPVSESVMYPWS